jgi:hypothetical protein
MPTDAERYNLLLQALATGIEDIRQALERDRQPLRQNIPRRWTVI